MDFVLFMGFADDMKSILQIPRRLLVWNQREKQKIKDCSQELTVAVGFVTVNI